MSAARGHRHVDRLREPRLHRRPLVVGDAEVGGVADLPVAPQHVLAEDPFERRADPEEGRPRLLVAGVGLELHPLAAEDLERVLQHEQLRLAVCASALPGTRDPGPTDLEPQVLRHDAQVTTAADRAARRALDRCERLLRSCRAVRDGRVEPRLKVGSIDRSGERPPPECLVERDLSEAIEVVARERLESNDPALKSDGRQRKRERRC